jgi:hypothetical protein
MHAASFLIPILSLGLGSAAMAQTTGGDLNTLVNAAAHYVSSGMAGEHSPETLALSDITGDNGSTNATVLMSSAADVQHWTFRYRIQAAGTPPVAQALPGCPAPTQPQPHRTVVAQCTQGVFNHFAFSPVPVSGVKSLEYTWVAVSLDQAIANLNSNGYVRGFSSVEVKRPDQAGLPQDLVYVFNCPWERQQVAISGQTGALTWTYSY